MKNINFIRVLALVLSYFFVAHMASAQISNTKYDGTINLINSTDNTKFNLIINSAGKVGIGTPTLTSAHTGKLNVAGTVDATGFTISGSPLSTTGPFTGAATIIGSDTWLSYTLGGNATSTASATTNNPMPVTLRINSGGSGTGTDHNDLIVDRTGHVGIGTLLTTTLSDKLTVNGAINATNLTVTSINTATPVANMDLTVKGKVVITNQATTGSPVISTARASAYNLFVEKGVVSEDFVIAATSTWSDFVFEHDYELQPLSEVENYVKENKHLPGIPSATEVKDGYGMNEMNKLFLQKIEELTLYVIQQDKKIKELESVISGAKK